MLWKEYGISLPFEGDDLLDAIIWGAAEAERIKSVAPKPTSVLNVGE